MQRIIRLLPALIVMLGAWPLQAQTTPGNGKSEFTLQEAVQYAVSNNATAINAGKDVEIGKQKIIETLASGLPQINGDISYNYNARSPVFVFPDVFGGDPTKFITFNAAPLNSMVISGVASMPVVSGQYFIGLQTAKIFLDLTRQQQEMTERDVKEQVTKTYYMVLIAEESVKILDSSIQVIKRNVYETEQLYANGLVEELDVEQLGLILNNTEDALIQAKNGRELALMALKYQMGFALEKPIVLKDDLPALISSNNFSTLVASLSDSVDVKGNLEYRLITQQYKINEKQYKLQFASAFPTLSTSFRVDAQSFNNERFIMGSGTQTVMGGVVWGWNLSIPIFSSWGRMSKLKQLKIEMTKTQNLQAYTEQGLKVAYQNARTQLMDNYKRFLTAEKNFKLAGKIRTVNNVKYKEGLISSLNLSQSEQQYYEAQQKYFQTVYELLNAKIALDKSLNKF